MLIKINRQEKYYFYLATPDYPEVQSKFKEVLQKCIDCTWNKFIDWNPLLRDVIKIQPADSWSVDYTLARIAVPLLEQLKETNHGYGFIEDEDVPEELRRGNDEHCEKKYAWFMNEIIWCLGEIIGDDKNAPEMPECADIFNEKTKTPDEKAAIAEWLKLHQEYDNRVANGCRLFGKYFRTLWD